MLTRDMITWANKGNATVKIDFLHSDDSPVTDVKPLIHKIHEVNFESELNFLTFYILEPIVKLCL